MTMPSHYRTAMASGRLWPKYPHGRFEIIMSTSLDQRKYLASLIVYAGAGGEDKAVWRLIVKSRGAHRNAARALEDLQEVLSIHIIKHDGMYPSIFRSKCKLTICQARSKRPSRLQLLLLENLSTTMSSESIGQCRTLGSAVRSSRAHAHPCSSGWKMA